MPNYLTQHQRILEILQNFRGIEPLKKLFWSELNYDQRNAPLSYQGGDALANDPILLAAGGTDGAFHIIYVHLNTDRLLLTAERPIISRLLGNHPYAMFVFSNREQTHWHFVNIKYDTDDAKKRRMYRRITISPYEKLRTASERIAMLDLESISPILETIQPLDIQTRHESAFDVEAVTKQFFEDYKSVFDNLQKDLKDQTDERGWAHDYSLQFLNRCMFLYFIQRKRWLGDDSGFLRTFWESYCSANQPDDSFVERWLNVLFFEAFNKRFHGGHRQFPDEIRKALASAPYLNGGLFTENALDESHHFHISDSRFVRIFDFLENYNFTIAEDSPLDQEVAVDPEMIGKVYESLVNVSAETDERGDAGIFYTPRTEIDLMCRLALVDNLANHLGEEHKPALYQAVFAFDPDDKTDADQRLIEAKLWNPIGERLSDIAIVDPACGSGAFLVGMLQILDDLRERANRALGREASSFDRKKAIIGSNLYGVDVMEWACHVAELRLWLALIIDAEFSTVELQLRNEPLLPHFSFNIRCGDSLVQEIGGMNLAQIRADFSEIPKSLKARTTRLKNEKLKFFNNDRTCHYDSEQELKQEEKKLFQALIDTRAEDIKKQIGDLQELIEGPRAQQIRLDGTIEERIAHQFELEAAEWRKQIETLTIDRGRLVQAHGALADARTLPFVWDIAFVEIFADDRRGFDMVIGNPPYVRQENILDPKLSREEMTDAQKKVFNKTRKAKLARSVYQAYPRYFGYKREKDVKPDNPSAAVSQKLDAKSDLYIYFYFHGLSLLNPKGSFCFITSNSWLDVGYGKDLQEFTLKHCRIKQIIDNRARRSFASADVNTVICLFSAPDESRQSGLDCTARFVSFNTPFEAILDPVIFYEIETAPERDSTPEHRVDPVSQKTLLERGIVGASPKPKYAGDKWGGKYLRAPDIYWTILEKGKDKLVRLGDIAEVRFGIKTGANRFFFLDDEAIRHWGIEEEFLKPVIKSPRECKSILIDPSQLKFKLFMCNKDKEDLKGTAALEYIEYGKSRRFDQRPSCSGRARWWDLGIWNHAELLWIETMYQSFRVHRNAPFVYESDKFYGIKSQDKIDTLTVLLNSTFVMLFKLLSGFHSLGEGALKTAVYEVKDFQIPLPAIFNFDDRLVNQFIHREVEAIQDEIKHSDRRALDAIIFDALNLTQGERDAVYKDVIDLVQARLQKASSLKET
ncbi:MAG: Eco57I restriction-modification methylase domain-containing protein [Candidatus Poribacteria bacterium]|nr:Eco57I restriction-modification methylase domain-containing protein [Candidatus Poribacteria bacterium]